MTLVFLRMFLILAVAVWPFQKGDRDTSLNQTQLEIPQPLDQLQWVRISLIEDAPEVMLETNEPYIVLDAEGRSLFRGDRMVSTKVQSNGEGIQIGSQVFKRTPLTIQSEGEGIKVGEKVYRHALKIWSDRDQKVSVVNEINVEDYLRGVLPWEANPGWHEEALKAQAVASRTYALFRAIERKDQAFALSKTVKSQVYKGKDIENLKTDKAIDRTRGEILTFNGKIFPTYFHSTCGGATTRADLIWSVKSHPVLEGVECDFCTESKHYRWNGSFPEAEIKKTLSQKGIQVNEIRAIRPVEVDRSGRPAYFEIEHDAGKTKVQSNSFRLWMNAMKFKSTKIRSLQKSGDQFMVRGNGWGHGVGLCQYGMKKLAELGYNYKQILEFYYPGADIKKIQY